MLNYSEYVTVAEKMTDEKGEAVLTTGLGSIHIFAVLEKDGLLKAEALMDTRSEASCEIVLKPFKSESTWKAVDMIAPLDAPVNTNMPTPEQKAIGDKRVAKANAMREEKTRNWVNPECDAFLHKTITDMEDSLGFPFREEMLNVLSEKDRTDCLSEVLEEHLDYSMPYWDSVSEEIFVSYIMNPRVDDEILRPYRKAILAQFSPEQQEAMRKNPVEIWNAVDQMIVSRPERERASVITTPAACLKTGIG
ncbi:transglutaminase domain-containing protein, partial [gut metagenome]